MSDFPGTRHELLRASYRQTSASAICKGCGAAIEWWKTNNGKPIPMDPMASDHSPAVAHFTTCPNAKEFRGADTGKPAAAGKPAPGDFGRDVRALRDRTGARVVVAIYPDATFAAWEDGIPGEDLRHDLISAGNFVRAEIQKKEGTLA